jgi:hypothetical protein
MARIYGVEEHRAGPVARAIFREVRRQAGKLSETFPILAHAPSVLRGWTAFEFFMGRAHAVEPKLRKLAELKAAVMIGCPF